MYIPAGKVSFGQAESGSYSYVCNTRTWRVGYNTRAIKMQNDILLNSFPHAHARPTRPANIHNNNRSAVQQYNSNNNSNIIVAPGGSALVIYDRIKSPAELSPDSSVPRHVLAPLKTAAKLVRAVLLSYYYY